MKRLCALLTVVGLLAGCSARTPDIGPEPTGTASLSPSPSPTTTGRKRPPRASAVAYAAGETLYVYDVAKDSLDEVASGGGLREPRWVNRNEVSFIDPGGDGDTLRIVDIKRRSVRDILAVETGIRTHAWSPDRETLAYVTVEDGHPTVTFKSMLGEGETLTVAIMAAARGRGISLDDQARIEFDRKGDRALIVFTPSDGEDNDEIPAEQSQLQIRGMDGALIHAGEPASEPTMGFWAPDGRFAYYRTDDGARTFNVAEGTLHEVRGGARWYNPWPSRDGRFVAYDTGASSARVRVRLLDLRTGDTRTIGARGWFHPVIADARTVWVQSVERCRGECEYPVRPGNDVEAIDLRTGESRELALGSLVDADVLYR